MEHVFDTMSFRTLERLADRHVGELVELFDKEWWTRGRSAADVRCMIDHSDLVFGLTEEPGGALAAFARVLTDRVYKAIVFDVIVADRHRGVGLGRRLLDLILTHPEIKGVHHVELYGEAEMIPFYENWGFTADLGDLRLMRRVGRERS